MAARTDRGGLGLTQRGLIADIVGVAAACVLVIAVLSAGRSARPSRSTPTFRVLTLAAAAAGAAAAILAGVAARLTGDPRPSWIAAALVLYCLIVLPWSTVVAVELDMVHRASRLVAYLGALVLLLLAIRPPRMLRAWGGWALLAGDRRCSRSWCSGCRRARRCGGWSTGPCSRSPSSADGRPPRPRSWPTATGGAAARASGWASGWWCSRSASCTGWRRLRPRRRRTSCSAGCASSGLVIVLVALAQLALLAVRSVESAQWRQQEELATAALHMGRAQEAAAERDHELRNGLAGLAGITHLLSDDTGSPHHERLKHAVLAELGRLHALLDGGHAGRRCRTSTTPWSPCWPGSWRCAGTRAVTLAVAPDLQLRGDPAVLAQIVTNLLVNCARHAPGADVTVTARSGNGVVSIEVRDAGPGLPPAGCAGGRRPRIGARPADQQAARGHTGRAAPVAHGDQPTWLLGDSQPARPSG